MALHGGCLCGATRYVIEAEPFGIGNCHCIDCQRASAAPFVNWGSVPRTSVRLEKGSLRKIEYAGRIRSFASCCGTPLFFEESPVAEELDVTIVSLDDPARYPPAKNIWIEDQQPWVQLDPRIPAFRRSSRELESES